eukprot:10863558-Alexandrium_andersonii.AAC.1
MEATLRWSGACGLPPPPWMLSLGWYSEVVWEPGCVAVEGERAACWLLEALAPRALAIPPPVYSDGALVGALAL